MVTKKETDKQIVKQGKLMIQGEFKTKMDLIVDVPKAGFANSNDSNMSRRFFIDPDLSAQIIGVNPTDSF